MPPTDPKQCTNPTDMYILVYICVCFLTEQYDPSHYEKKLTHIVYYKYQQRSLQR